MSAHSYDHGHTVAGWTGFGIAGAGAAVVGFGIVTVSGPLLVGGASIALAGLVVTWVLHLAGWGKPPGPRPREQWGWRVRDLSARQGHAECLGCRLAGRGRGGVRAAAGPVVVPAARGGAPDARPSVGAGRTDG
ncbi:HGxxPAAW family protein [Streptomyces caelestis]|uniref:HGxxPAAW family protein n=1 Tax=Streptomyces TaxID=1883 RepID=UPI0004C50AD6|nr:MULTISPECIES: HGxxPAAW family protein [Streptomyces]